MIGSAYVLVGVGHGTTFYWHASIPFLLAAPFLLLFCQEKHRRCFVVVLCVLDLYVAGALLNTWHSEGLDYLEETIRIALVIWYPFFLAYHIVAIWNCRKNS